MKRLYDSRNYFLLDQLQERERNKVIWVYVMSQFMQPLIYRYNQDINFETVDIENYCPVSGEALLCLLLKNIYDYLVANLKRKNKLNEETAETPHMPTQKYTKGTQGGNVRSFGG